MPSDIKIRLDVIIFLFILNPDKSGITQVVLAASSRESKPEDISFCHCGVERETAMIGKEVRGGADVDHNDE